MVWCGVVDGVWMDCDNLVTEIRLSLTGGGGGGGGSRLLCRWA